MAGFNEERDWNFFNDLYNLPILAFNQNWSLHGYSQQNEQNAQNELSTSNSNLQNSLIAQTYNQQTLEFNQNGDLVPSFPAEVAPMSKMSERINPSIKYDNKIEVAEEIKEEQIISPKGYFQNIKFDKEII